MYDIPLREAFDKVDQRWVEAFGGRELRLSGGEGVDKFKRSLAGEHIPFYHQRKPRCRRLHLF